MPLEYLRLIARGPLPVQVTHESQIDKLRVLVAAELVIADLPPLGRQGAAVVHEITAVGQAWLNARSDR